MSRFADAEVGLFAQKLLASMVELPCANQTAVTVVELPCIKVVS
jgi:hypothetical protein